MKKYVRRWRSVLLPMAQVAALLLAGWFTAPVQAQNRWTVCDYTVQTTRASVAEHTITATIVAHRQANPAACPGVGEAMTFTPETAGYQSHLPRKRWPVLGQRVHLRYRFLDGECKASGPCRIEHHSVMQILARGAAVRTPPMPLRDGEYVFSHYFAEHPNMGGQPLTVRIAGLRVTVLNRSPTSVFPVGVIEEGTLFWRRKSKQWIIADQEEDRRATEVGGCSDGPSMIDLENRVYWSC